MNVEKGVKGSKARESLSTRVYESRGKTVNYEGDIILLSSNLLYLRNTRLVRVLIFSPFR